MKNTKILAIDPGSRYCGYSFINGKDMLNYGVKQFKNRSDKEYLQKVRDSFSDLISEFQPQILVIEKPALVQYQTLCYLGMIYEEIKKIGENMKLEIYEYSPLAIRKALCGYGRATKRETAQIVCKHYPELQKYLDIESTVKGKYWSHVFDATAAAILQVNISNENIDKNSLNNQ
jgi:crossover junction endodeoxyribonuclease RuvC